MGAGPRVIGVGNFDRYPPEALTRPKVGGLIDPDVERIISLKPDLVVVYGTQNDLRTQMERAGIPMFLYQHAGLADITATIRRARRARRQRKGERGPRRPHRSGHRRRQASGSPAGRGRARCSCSGAMRKRFEAFTRAAASDFFTTCSRRPVARTCLPTSSARAFRRRASSRWRARPRSSSRSASTRRARAAAISARGNALAVDSGRPQQTNLPAARRRHDESRAADIRVRASRWPKSSIRRRSEVDSQYVRK